MKIEYFVDERQTGRTTNIVEDLLHERALGNLGLIVVPNFKMKRSVIETLRRLATMKEHEIQLTVATEEELHRRLRGVRMDTLYLDCADYLQQHFLRIGETYLPNRLVVVLVGKLYQRILPPHEC